jgi:hypothetical protein
MLENIVTDINYEKSRKNKYGINTNVLGGFGQTILDEAADSGNLGLVRYVIENCNIDAKPLNKLG